MRGTLMLSKTSIVSRPSGCGGGLTSAHLARSKLMPSGQVSGLRSGGTQPWGACQRDNSRHGGRWGAGTKQARA